MLIIYTMYIYIIEIKEPNLYFYCLINGNNETEQRKKKFIFSLFLTVDLKLIKKKINFCICMLEIFDKI
jgi:hypothetical protein